jgi:hypothetical protein
VEWRPFVVGEAIRLTAHLTRTGGQFKPYTEGRATLTLTVEKVTTNAASDGPERPGVFRLNVTPTRAGTGRIVIDVSAATVAEHFVIDDVPVYCHYWTFAHRVSPFGHLQQIDAVKAAKAKLLQRKPEFSRAFARRRLFSSRIPPIGPLRRGAVEGWDPP